MNPTRATKLSIALIVRDAAETLAETLESVHAIADEIVVLDTGSCDKTLEVARRYGAKIVPGTWQDDFSGVRNHAATHCMGEFILWLDAGERMSPDAARELREFVNTRLEPATAYMLVIRLPLKPGEIAGEQIGMIRLVPNDPRIQFTGRVRETLMPSLVALKIPVEGIPYRIDRGLRENEPDRRAARAQRNARLAEMELRERCPNAVLLNCLGDAFQTLGQHALAAQSFRQAIGIANSGTSEMLAAYYGLVATLEHSDQGRGAQLAACLAALEVFPTDAQLLCATGGYMQSQGQLEMARRAYHAAWHFGKVHPDVWHLDGIREVAGSCYARALELLNQLVDAKQLLLAAVEEFPFSARLRRQLIALYVRQGRRKEALAEVERLPPETPYREALSSAVRGACLAVQNKWVPARAYLEAAYRGGCRDAICLQWFAQSLLTSGQLAAAIPVLAEWRQVDPHNPALLAALADVAARAANSDTNTRPLPVPILASRGGTGFQPVG